MKESLILMGRHVRAAGPCYRLISYVVGLAFGLGVLVGVGLGRWLP